MDSYVILYNSFCCLDFQQIDKIDDRILYLFVYLSGTVSYGFEMTFLGELTLSFLTVEI